MASSTPLFTIPIDSTNGSITCTQPQPKVYLLTFSSPPDNRHTPDFCKAFVLALDIIDFKLPKGVVVTTSAIQKFYSNGLDYENAIKDKNFWENSLYPLWRRLLTYPMPTIALINGHCFAAGIMTAMMHDYRVMNPHKGFIATNELDFGAPMRPAMLGIFRMKLPRPDTLRTMILEAKRFPALEALKEGLVDMLGGAEEVLALIKEKKLVGRADTGVYGVLKEEMWRETVQMLDDVGPVELAKDAKEAAVNRKWVEKGQRNVAEFEAQQRSGKAKL